MTYSDEVRRRVAETGRAGALEGAASASGSNPACGDVLTISVRLAGGRVAAARFRAHGCPHLLASADAACEALEREGAAPTAEAIERLLGGLPPTGRHAAELAADVAAAALREAGG